jgi:hypothetical protein
LVEKSEIIKINKLDQDVLDYNMAQAFIIIHCLKSQEETIIQHLNNISEIVEIDMLVGSYEIICKIVALHIIIFQK